MSRMMLYLWHDTLSVEAPTKLGDHFIEGDVTLEEAEKNVKKYIRLSLQRQKVRLDKGEIRIVKIWDVSEYAQKYGRFYKHAKVDDLIRLCVPFHVEGDIHKIDPDEAVVLVNEHLAKSGTPLPEVTLSTAQMTVGDEVIEAIANGKRTVLAELCARFGKTIWAGAVIKECNFDLTIIASYVLTAHASFKKDLTSWEQFRNFDLVDMHEYQAKEKITEGLAHGRQVIVTMSLCKGSKRNPNIDWLFDLPVSRAMFVDEADYGAHKEHQVEPLMEARKTDDVVILMTGTNPDRASSSWPVDYHVNVTYPELILAKKKAGKP